MRLIDVDAGQEDAGSRLQHLWVIAMLQAGLSPKTINRVAAILPMVCQRFAEYKTSQLADAWMKREIEGKGIVLPEPKDSTM